jgi:hypothetical protein
LQEYSKKRLQQRYYTQRDRSDDDLFVDLMVVITKVASPADACPADACLAVFVGHVSSCASCLYPILQSTPAAVGTVRYFSSNQEDEL